MVKSFTLSNYRSLITITFGASLLAAPFLLHSVYGIKPLDPGYAHYGDGTVDGVENTPYQDFIANGCMTEPNTGQDKLIFDTAGLDELGLFWYDPNTCFDIAKAMSDTYTITNVTVDSNDRMIIELTKKK
jgi:hypothetical protein